MPRGAIPCRSAWIQISLPRGGVERHQRVVPRQQVHHVVDDQGIPNVGDVVVARVAPRDREVVDIAFRNLAQGRVVRVVRPATVICPRAVVGLGGRQPESGDAAKTQPRSGHRSREPLLRNWRKTGAPRTVLASLWKRAAPFALLCKREYISNRGFVDSGRLLAQTATP